MNLGFTSGVTRKKGPTKKWTKSEIDAELKKFDDKIQEAREREGDTEIRDHHFDKAAFMKDEVRDFVEAEKLFRETIKLSGTPSRKLEPMFEILLMNLEKVDIDSLKKDMATCHQLIADGADWDKKNKLKVFEACYCMLIRDFNKAAELLMSSIPTFTCVELLDYKQFIFYAVIMALLTQNRKLLKKEIIHSPDVLSVIRDIPHLKKFANSFYDCEYKAFFEAFVGIMDTICTD